MEQSDYDSPCEDAPDLMFDSFMGLSFLPHMRA
jgi:hypothetical protein